MEWVDGLATKVRQATPARIFTGRAGTSYRTAAALQLRADHAAARDAVAMELDTEPPAAHRLSGQRPISVAQSQASSKPEFLQRPDLGRHLADRSRKDVSALPAGADLQIVLGDGLSARALAEQAPVLVDLLHAGAAKQRWVVGQLVVVRYCRVGIVNDFGDLLDPTIVVLLIGERPGLATASSLSAYLAYRPRTGHTDAQRNLVSNIHSRGLTPAVAAERIFGVAEAMRAAKTSGVRIKES